MIERLQKTIARSGYCSRRAAEDLIAARRVTVDGDVAVLGQKVDPDSAEIRIDGVVLPVAPGLVYYLVNKPVDVVSTATDTHGRPTVTDLVPAEPRVFPVGRLDQDSTGLMVLTNDGRLAQRLTHPRHQVTKTYVVKVAGTPGGAELRRLVDGVDLEDGPARALAVRELDRWDDEALIEITMGEGRKREVRRMFAAIETPVLTLFRSAIGPLRDGALKPGDWRELTIDEVRVLYEAAGDE